MTTLGQVSLDGFVKRTVAYLSASFPAEVNAQGLDIAGLEVLTHEGVAGARYYNVVNETDVVRFVECMLLLGRRFDDDENYAWARETLRRTDLTGVAKMDLIDEYRIFALDQAR